MADSLRVLIVTLDYPPPPGGIQTIVKNLEIGLQQLGHETRILHIDKSDFEWSVTDLIPRRKLLNDRNTLFSRDFVYLNAVYRKTIDHIDKYNPDIVHGMHVWNWPAIVAANERDIPTVLSTYALELSLKSLSEAAIREVNVVHALTHFTESLVRKATDAPVSVEIIPPSIDVPAYQDAVNNKSSKKGPIVTIARFVDRKNIETILKAWDKVDESLKKEHGLIIAGDGPNRERLENLAKDYEKIRFTGWVNGQEKRNLLAKSSIFAMVPRQNGYDVEGFGIVYIEAQAAGSPVVGSKHGGAPEAIGDAGIIVDDENDPVSVAEAIELLLTDETTRQRCVKAAADRINKFDIPQVTRQHIDVYKSIK